MNRRVLGLAFSPFAFVALACGGQQASSSPTQAAPAAPPGQSVSGATATSSAALPASTTSDAHALVVSAAACWLGGVWGDALDESGDARKAGTDARCSDVARQIYGTDDKTHYEKLRAIEPATVEDMAQKVAASEADTRLLRALADAQREAMEARRAADRVRKDVAGQREADKLAPDEVAAVAPLRSAKALDALVKLDAGPFAHDAHALGVLTAMDRVESSRGLPKHLKIYAMEGTFAILFNTPHPSLPDDATKRIDRGAYLTYMTEVAKMAGHPVPETTKAPRDREPLAWAGALMGLSDKLGEDKGQIKSAALADVAARVAKRLEGEYTAAHNADAAKTIAPAPAAAGTAAPSGPKSPKPPPPPGPPGPKAPTPPSPPNKPIPPTPPRM